ncbi:hypothetical protein [Haliangium sp.]|uniref:hypothetical protein n=1 Tax=Haliangium sp. TaxID=2663208 RepID=UPI003D0B1537
MSDPTRILITGAGGPLGVNVTRSLRAAASTPGAPPATLVGTDCNRWHLPLALTDEVVLIPPARDTDAYLAALGELISARSIDLIVPTHPVEVRTLSAHRNRFTGVRFMLPPHEAILLAQDKWRTHCLLRDAGLPVPLTRLIGRRSHLDEVFDELATRPVWVRGAGVPGAGIGVASLPCREVAHAAAWVDHHQGWGKFIASEYLPGANLTWCGLFYRGELVMAQSRERLEYVLPHVSPSGITGAPAVSRTVSRPDVRDSGEAAVRALPGPPHGVYFVDLKEDAHGVARITEINAGRFGTTIHFYTEAGANFVAALAALALGRSLPGAPEGRLFGAPAIDPVAPGTYWIRTLDCGPVLVTDFDHPAEASPDRAGAGSNGTRRG